MSREIEKLAREILAAAPGAAGAGGDTYVTEAAFLSHTGDAAAHQNPVSVGAGGLSAKLNMAAGQILTLAAINHSDLSSIGASDHHNPVSIGAGGLSARLAMNASQVLTLSAVYHSDLSSIGANDHHNQVHAITDADHTVTGAALDLVGLSGTNALGILTPSANPGTASKILKTNAGQLIIQDLQTPLLTVSGSVASSLIPSLTDSYDLGAATKLWRKGWLSELESILFVQNSVQVTGGWWMVPHGSGTLPADVVSGATQIDFGAAMTPGDFVLLRGNLAVEYLQIGTLVSGTTYNVTRNLDGTGANDWPAGHVFVILGNTGDGRIEFDAQTAGPRVSVFEQGAAYNTQTERVRIGDLSGWGSLTGYGVAIGTPAGNRLTYDPTNGLVIAGEGSGVTNINGGNIQADTITATQISATAIDGMTITGATIRTSPSNEAVMDADGLSIMPAFDGWDPTGASSVKWSSVGLIEGRLDTDLVEPNDPLYAYVRLTTDGGTTKDASIHLSTQINPVVADYAEIAVAADQLLISAPTAVTGTLSATGIITGSAGARLEGLEIGRLTLTPTPRQLRMYHSDGTLVGQLSISDINYLRINQDSGKSVYVNGTLHTEQGLNAVTGMTLGAFSVPITNQLRMYNGATFVGQFSVTDTTWLRVNQDTGKNVYTPNSIAIGTHLAVGHTNIGSAGDISYTGTLRSRKNSTYYDVFGVTPLTTKLTSTSWDGDAKTTGSSGTIDLSAVFGVPAGVKAVLVRLAARSTTLDLVAAAGPNSSNLGLICRTNVVSRYSEAYGVVACDSNGDIYFYASGNLDNVFLEVFGYAI